MRRVLDLRFLAYFGGIALAVGIAVHLLHSLQVSRQADVLLRQGELALEAGNVEQALTYFEHYLTFRRRRGPLTAEDAAALEQYALLLESRARTAGERLQAVLALEDSLRIAAGAEEVRRRLALQQIVLGNIRSAITHLQELAKGKADAELHHMLGWCFEAEKRYPEAATEFRKAIALDPTRLASYELLAQTVLKLPAPAEDREPLQEALKVVDAMVAANPKNARAYLQRGRFREENGDEKGAEADLEQALRMAPREPAVVLAAARRDLKADQPDLARARLEEARRHHPKNAELLEGLVGLELRAGRRAEALALLAGSPEVVAESWVLQVLQTDLFLDRGRLDEATDRIARLRSLPAAALPADYLQGRLLVRQGRWKEALPLLEKLRGDMHPRSDWSSRVDALLGTCWYRLGDYPHMLGAFRRVVLRDPDWTEARLGLAQALLLTGRLEEALRELASLEKTTPSPKGFWTTLGRALLEKNLRLPSDQRDWERIRTALDRAASEDPQALEVLVLRAGVLEAEGKISEARKVLEEAAEAHPEELGPRSALAEFAGRHDPAAAGRILDRAEKDLGDRLEIRLARAALLLRDRGLDGPARLRALAADTGGFTPQELGTLLRHLGETAQRLGRTAEAEEFWHRLVREQPRDTVALSALFDLALARKDFEEARLLHRKLSSVDESSRLGRYATAALLVAEGGKRPEKLQEADRILQHLRAGHPDWARIPLLQARIEERRGRADRALDHRLEALELGDPNLDLALRVVRELLARNRLVDADSVLNRLLERRGPTPEIQRLAAEIALALGDRGRAGRVVDDLEKTGGRDYRDLLWLGRTRHALGQDDRAEALLRGATEAHPRTPEVWVALIEHLHRTGKHAAARAVLKDAQAQVDPRQRLYVAALGSEALGDPAAAETYFDQALAADPEDFIVRRAAAAFHRRTDQPGKALEHFAHLLGKSSNLPPEMIPAARRSAALLMAEQEPTPSMLDRAIQLVEGDGPRQPADERVLALLRSYRPGQGRESLRLFREASKKSPAEAEELLSAARAHARLDDPLRAAEILTDLLATDPDNPQYLAAHIRALIQSDDVALAVQQLRRLEALEPGSQRTLELRRRLGKTK